MNKIILGTAQFGLDYGINNKTGMISEANAEKILRMAIGAGINTLDTASAYGKSEKVLGKLLKTVSEKVNIISKLPQCAGKQVCGLFEDSINDLGINSLYGYLVHDIASYKKDHSVWSELERLKNTGKVEKIGFSIYLPDDLEYLLNDGLKIDIIQFPYSIFDQRFAPYLEVMKKHGIESHCRSVFLQGLVFKSLPGLDPYFNDMKEHIGALNSISKKYDVSVLSLCLNFALSNKQIDKVVIGVDSPDNLKKIVAASTSWKNSEEIMKEAIRLSIDDERFILPFNWKPKAVKS